MKDLSPATRRILLIAAGLMLAVGVIWFILLESNSYTNAACDRINRFGYHASPSQLRIGFYGEKVSITDSTDLDLEAVVPYSESCGFGSDIEKVGTVELYFWDIDADCRIEIWFVDKQPELVYVYDVAAEKYYPLDGR